MPPLETDPCGKALLSLLGKADHPISLLLRGDSMTPLIRDGENITIRLMRAYRPKRGDIVAFWRDEKLVVHRIVRILTDLNYIEKGDSSPNSSRLECGEILGLMESLRSGETSACVQAPFFKLSNRLLGFIGGCRLHPLAKGKLQAYLLSKVSRSIAELTRAYYGLK